MREEKEQCTVCAGHGKTGDSICTRCNIMKKVNFRFLVIAAIAVSAALFAVVLCSCTAIIKKAVNGSSVNGGSVNDVSVNDVSDNTGGLTVTDIPAELNGAYAQCGLINLGDAGFVGYGTMTVDKRGYYKFTYSPISNGKVTIPLWIGSAIDGFERYTGDGTVYINIITIYNVGTYKEYSSGGKMLGIANYHKSVELSKGNATISWNDMKWFNNNFINDFDHSK